MTNCASHLLFTVQHSSQQALILRSYWSLEVDDDFDAPQLMDEDVFYDDNGASDNYCRGNGGENEVKFFKQS